MSEDFQAEGEVRILGAHIGGQFRCDGGKFHNQKGPALNADGLVVDQDMLCCGTFESEGEVRVLGAHIGGQFQCDGGKFRNPSGSALNADGLVVDQHMFCSDDFEALGEVRLRGTRIGGQFLCTGGKFSNANRPAINADWLAVAQHMFCGIGFEAEGEVSLIGAHIGGRLGFTGGKFRNPDSLAVNGGGLIVDHDMLCMDGFEATGTLSLVAAKIAGSLYLDRATLRKPTGTALDLERATVGSTLVVKPAILEGSIDLQHTQVGVFDDDPKSWGPTRLDGFTYGALRAPLSARQRCTWIGWNLTGYSPQPYEQLAASLRRQGDDAGARVILIEKLRRRRQGLRRWQRTWDWFLDRSVLYGYETWRAVGLLVVLWLVGLVAFHVAKANDLLAPVQERAAAQPDFHASLYSLDVLVPVLTLHQFDAWAAHGWALWAAIGLRGIGWMLTTLVVLSLTGIFRRA